MQTTTERPTGVEPKKPRRLWLPVTIGILVLAVFGAGFWLMTRSSEDTATDVMQDVAKAMRNEDTARLEELLGPDDLWFLEWQMALKAEPEFTNCAELAVATGGTRVACDVAHGDELFYAQVLGKPLTGTVAGIVEDGAIRITDWPPPRDIDSGSTVLTIEGELRTWVQAAHPELEDDLYGFPGFFGIKMTQESAELRMQLLDEFLASR